MDQNRVFITGFKHFDIVFVPGRNEVVSQFEGEHNLQMKNATADTDSQE